MLILALPANSDEPKPTPAYDTVQDIRLLGVSGDLYAHTGAADDQFSIRKSSSFVDLNVLDNDAAPGSTSSELLIVATGAPSSGGELINYVSHLTYLPPPGFTGVDSFTYTMADQSGITSTATVFVKNLMPWRIMPIGDSITEASGSRNSYRRPLWHLLNDAGLDIDFVGSRSGNRDGQVPNPDFDTDHEGHWGWRADQFLQNNNIDNWAQSHQPDVALIHLGTNDIFQGQSVSETIDEIGQIIDRLRAVNPDVIVLVAQIIPTSDPARPSLSPFNQAIPGLASSKSTQRSPVLVVDQNSGFNAAANTYDSVHPNLSGETKMADKWNVALAPLISTPTTIDLEISPRSSSISARVREDLQLNFSVRNSGNATATAVEVVVTRPAESVLISGPTASNGATCRTSGRDLICGDDLNPNSRFDISFAIEFVTSGVFELIAVARSAQSDANNSNNTGSIKVTVENMAPVLTAPIPDADLVAGSSYTADLSSYFSDPEGEALTFAADTLPAGLQLAGTTGIISGTPSIVGSTTVTLSAIDSAGATADDKFVIHVVAPSTPPPPPAPAPAPTQASGGGGAMDSPAILTLLLLFFGMRFKLFREPKKLLFTTLVGEQGRP